MFNSGLTEGLSFRQAAVLYWRYMNPTAERKLKIEKRAMNFSFAGSLAFVIAELVSFLMTGSHTILMDFLFDGVDMVLIGPFLLLIPLLYKPVTERHPYGYSQFESLFIVIKYGILLLICIFTIVQNIQLILSGGHDINVEDVALFEVIVMVGCLAVYLILRYYSNRYASDIIRAELYLWRLDVVSSCGIAVAFFVASFLRKTSLSYLTPYVDPIVAIGLTLILLVEPCQQIVKNMKELLLFSAPSEVTEKVRKIAQEELDKFSCEITFLEVIQTGRKTWVEIYINSDSDTVSVHSLSLATRAIRQRLKDLFDQSYVDIIPDVPE